MNINKKFDRFKQWTNERLGAEARTGLSEDFKALEMEMNLRHEGMFSVRHVMCNCSCSSRPRQDAQIHGHIRQVALEACRGRRPREADPGRPSWLHHGHPRRGL